MDGNIYFICPKCAKNTILIEYVEFTPKKIRPTIYLKCKCSQYPIVIFSFIECLNKSIITRNKKANNSLLNFYETITCDITNNYDSIMYMLESIKEGKNEIIENIKKYYNWIIKCFNEIETLIIGLYNDYAIGNKSDENSMKNYNSFTLTPLEKLKSFYVQLNQQLNKDNLNLININKEITTFYDTKGNLVLINQSKRVCNLKSEKYFSHFYSFFYITTYKEKITYNKPISFSIVHKDSIESVCELSDGKIATGAYDKTIKIWEKYNPNPLFTLTGHTGAVLTIGQLTNGLLFSGSSDCLIKLWDLNKKTHQSLQKHQGSIIKIIQMVNGLMVSCSVDSTIRVWNINNNFESFSLEGHEQTVESVVEMENNILFSCSLDKTCKLWDINAKICLKTIELNAPLIFLDKFKENEVFLVTSEKSIILLNCYTGKVIKTKEFEIPIYSVGHCNNVIFCGFSDKKVRVMSYPYLEEEKVLCGHNDTVIFVKSFSNNSLCSSSWDGSLMIWENI